MKYIYIYLSFLGFLLVACGSSNEITKDENRIIITSVNGKDTNLSEKKLTQESLNEVSFSPILRYSFDSCVLDDIDGIRGDAKLVKSILNNGLWLDGNDFIKIPTMDVNYTAGFTFSSWVSFDEEASEGENWESIFSFGNDDSLKAYEDKHKNEIWLNRYYKENKLYFAFTNGDRDNPCGDVKTIDNVIKPHILQHIAVTIDERNYPHIFVDGKEVETTVAWHNAGGACELSSVKRELCYIGKPNDEWMGLDHDGGSRDHKDNNLLKGVIDEVMVFNEALDESEIYEIYDAQRRGLNYDKTKRELLVCDSNTTKQKPSKIEIKIDANSDDWADIEGISEGDFTIKSHVDSEFVYFLLESKSVKDVSAIWFIDSDNNPTTGHQASEWDKSGADFAIGSAGKLYVAKSDDAVWDWDDLSLDDASGFASKDGVIEVKVKKSDFDITGSYRVGARVDVGQEDSIAVPKSNFLLNDITLK